MPPVKKPKLKKPASREDLIKQLNIELLAVEAKFIDSVVEKFDEVINSCDLSPEECVELLHENRKGLGSEDYDRFFVSVLDEIFNYAQCQYDNDIDNGDDIGFLFAFQTASEKHSEEIYDEIENLKRS
jgi:hypothetical protein